jgi:hypothetical protein
MTHVLATTPPPQQAPQHHASPNARAKEHIGRLGRGALALALAPALYLLWHSAGLPMPGFHASAPAATNDQTVLLAGTPATPAHALPSIRREVRPRAATQSHARAHRPIAKPTPARLSKAELTLPAPPPRAAPLTPAPHQPAPAPSAPAPAPSRAPVTHPQPKSQDPPTLPLPGTPPAQEIPLVPALPAPPDLQTPPDLQAPQDLPALPDAPPAPALPPLLGSAPGLPPL